MVSYSHHCIIAWSRCLCYGCCWFQGKIFSNVPCSLPFSIQHPHQQLLVCFSLSFQERLSQVWLFPNTFHCWRILATRHHGSWRILYRWKEEGVLGWIHYLVHIITIKHVVIMDCLIHWGLKGFSNKCIALHDVYYADPLLLLSIPTFIWVVSLMCRAIWRVTRDTWHTSYAVGLLIR